MSNNIENIKKERAERQARLSQGGGTISPNPASLILKWAQTQEKVRLEGGREIEVPSGGFAFYKKAEGDVAGKKVFVPQSKFAMAILDHTIIQIQGAEYTGQVITRQYWSNEMRFQDCMTTPFILKMKGADKAAKPTTIVDTYQNLKHNHGISGRMHVIYGLSANGDIIKLILPFYSYALGSDRFKTHGDTLLDADAKSIKEHGAQSGGLLNRWLEYDGYHELTTGTAKYTAPKFKFGNEYNEEMLIQLNEKAEPFDAWYKEYHQANLTRIDTPDQSTHQGSSTEGSHSQEPVSTAASLPVDDYDDDGDIPF